MLFQEKETKPRKKCYYPFAKNYPGKRGSSYDIGESRTRRKKEKRNGVIFYSSLVVLFVAVFIIASVASDLSKRPIERSGNKAAEYDGQLKALYMPDDALSGGIAFDLFTSQLNEAKANAVVIDFKKADGTLNYDSSFPAAIDINASSGAYQSAKETISRLKESGYKIIARIYCYEDTLASSMLSGAAVTEKDTVTVWLDDSAQNDGNPWLNPYSQTAENYLLGIIAESVSVGADVVMLAAVSFPSGNRTDRAFFAGEAESVESRNSVLHSFIDKAAAVTVDVPVVVYMTADEALNGSSLLYSGSIFDSGALFDAVDFRAQSLTDGFAVGAQTYSQQSFTQNTLIQAAVPLLKEKTEENYTTKGVIPIIDDEIYVSTLENLGINNYILIKN